MKKWAMWLVPGLTVALVDQAVKLATEGMERPLIPGVVAIRSAHNSGMAMGMLQGRAVGILGISVLLIGVCAWLLVSLKPQGLAAAAVSMMAGGALGNMVDRLAMGYVRDMFDLQFMDFYVFNVADIGVVLGAVMCGISVILLPKEWRKNE
ncbi:MAG: signal peptidase II [Clostridia bacterium]|nr:signal peptidase II [Clostridia bacterium]